MSIQPHRLATTNSDRRQPTRRTSGLGQLSLVEHALSPLDARASLKPNLDFQCAYHYTDQNRKRQTARARVLAPLGLSAADEFYLWGLLALTFAQPMSDPELHATPHYCLRQLGLIDKDSRRGGRQYQLFRDAIDRLSAVTYRNDRFYDPIRAEHRQVSFGFLSYSLPLDPDSARAWRISWDRVFFEFVTALGGHFRFDLATYRELDVASRRLFLFLSKIFARREVAPRSSISHLGTNVLGFGRSLEAWRLRPKIARVVNRLVEVGVVEAESARFEKNGVGSYSLTLRRGPYYTRRPNSRVSRGISHSASFEPLLNLGFADTAAIRLVRKYPPHLLREWIDITLAAKERFGESFFKRSPQAYLVDNLKNAIAGTRTPPDWWHEIRKAERKAADKTDLLESLGIAAVPIPDEATVEQESMRIFHQVQSEMFGHFIASGATKADAQVNSARLAREHVDRRRRRPSTGLTKVESLFRKIHP